MPSTVLTTKGQITLPIEVRKQLGLKTGDRLEFTRNVETGRFEVSRKTGSVMDLCGTVKSAKPAIRMEEINEVVAKAAVDRYRGTVKKRD